MGGQPFLTAEWRQLAMLNYAVDPEVLAPLVPAGVELDTYGGRTLVSMVGFLFEKTRVLGVSVPFHHDFDEVNLRFYVRRKAEDGWRRGVVFVKEIVPLPAVAVVARVLYNEKYVALPMRHSVEDGRRARYSWHFSGKWNSMEIVTAGEGVDSAPGSEEEFITEHYWGYTAQRDGSTIEYRVEHPKWKIWRAATAQLDCDVAALYGPEFAEFLSKPPASALLADGSAVSVYRGQALAL